MSLNAPIRDWTTQRVWIIGASSGIGASLARALSQRGAAVALSARRADALQTVASDLPGERHLILPLDITAPATVSDAQDRLWAAWGGYDLVVVMAGNYVPMDAWNFQCVQANALLAVNLHGPLIVLEYVLPRLRRQGHGGLAFVSSAAGYRGLPKSLIYGPSKAAVINLAESLYFDLHPLGLAVYLVNPGFVRTPLTARNPFKMPALITAEEAAEEIVRGFSRGDFEIHFPRRFTGLLKLLRMLPYRWYFPLVKRITKS
ncbi:MAG: SDR family NAD(P)-dependent oxidoreductase [Gammaproteobacteria bacterium]|nr:SDR family NAD(P)-dependent oxidoreductase [Gammaproteobacteria bacterium]